MYRFIRNVHLLAGLLASGYLFMYASSAVEMSHREWFGLQPKVTERKVKLKGEFADSPRAAARELMDRQGIRGELRNVQKTASGFRIRVARIGALTDVDYDRASGEASIKISEAAFGGALVQLHHVAGFWHETGYFIALGSIVAVVSVILFVLGASGIYLWFKIHGERVTGGILLGLNLVYAVGLIICMSRG